MTDWKIAMVVLLPLMLGPHRARTWAAVMASSLLAMLAPSEPVLYLTIDILCGAVVLMRPAGLAQRSIGMLFASMAVLDLGYLLSARADGGYTYTWVLSVLGWLQFAILATWGTHDTGSNLGRVYRRYRHTVAVAQGDGQ